MSSKVRHPPDDGGSLLGVRFFLLLSVGWLTIGFGESTTPRILVVILICSHPLPAPIRTDKLVRGQKRAE